MRLPSSLSRLHLNVTLSSSLGLAGSLARDDVGAGREE